MKMFPEKAGDLSKNYQDNNYLQTCLHVFAFYLIPIIFTALMLISNGLYISGYVGMSGKTNINNA